MMCKLSIGEAGGESRTPARGLTNCESSSLYSQKVKNKLVPTVLNLLRRFAGFAISACVCILVLSTSAVAQTGTTGSAAAMAPASSLALVPMPREIHPRELLSLKDGMSVETTSHDPQDKFAVTDLVETLKDRGVVAREGHHRAGWR